LTHTGPLNYTLAGAVRQNLRVEGRLDQGPLKLAVAASDPTVEIDLKGAEQKLTLTVDLGEVQLSAPYSAVNPDALASGTFAIDWKGITATVTLDQTGISFKNVSLGNGTSTIKLDDVTLVAIDLNPA